MKTKILKEALTGISSIISLEAAKHSGSHNISLNSLGMATKLLSFSDYNYDSIIGSLGITTASTVDDILIDNGLLKNHHFTKLACGLYAGYKLSNNTHINSIFNFAKSDSILTTLAIGSSLTFLSYLFGSGDMVNIMRTNTKDCIDFSEKVSQLSDGSVNTYTDMQIATAINGVVGGGRQLLNDFKLEMGAPLNGAIATLVNTGVSVACSAQSQQEFQDVLVKKFSKKLEQLGINSLNILKTDKRAEKVLNDLPNYISKSVSGITKTAANSSLKTAYSQILAGYKYENKADNTFHNDGGLSVFVAANLFNKCNPDNLNQKFANKLKQDDLKLKFTNNVQSSDIEEIQSSLRKIESKHSTFKTVTEGCEKIFNFIVPTFINAMMVGAMHKKDFDTTGVEKFMSNFNNNYMPVAATLSIGETFVDTDTYDAMTELQYLSDKIDAMIYHY